MPVYEDAERELEKALGRPLSQLSKDDLLSLSAEFEAEGDLDLATAFALSAAMRNPEAERLSSDLQSGRLPQSRLSRA